MPRVVAHEEDDISPYISGDGDGELPTLAQLLKEDGDEREAIAGDETPSAKRCAVDPKKISLVLSFENLCYSVNVRRKLGLSSILPRRCAAVVPRKDLLKDISGEARDGEILAVLGPSGSGKSTLIDALAHRIARESLKGAMKLNGEILESRTVKLISAYVMQSDLLFPMLTVEETLNFAAEFRLPRTVPKSKKKLRVQALIDQLGLRDAANTIIGDEGHRGISGGERRRVSIGIDIVHDPLLLFLDEPTSGLDSTSAFLVVQVLKTIAQSGSAVIMSIHQPSYRIFCLLDRLIFLSHGQTVFSGSPENLPRFFSDLGHPIPADQNHSEFALDFIQEMEEYPDGTMKLAEFNKKWQQTTANSESTPAQFNLSLKETISARLSTGKLISGQKNNNLTRAKYANPHWVEIIVLIKRYLTNSSRMPELLLTRLATVMLTSFVLATLFWHIDDSPKGVIERLGFLSFTVSTVFYITAEALPEFIQERFIFLRETSYNSYRTSSYVIYHSLVTIPFLFILTMAFAAATFFPVGLQGGPAGFMFFCSIIFAAFWSGNSLVTLISSIIPHLRMSYVITISLLSYFLLLGGFYINRDRIPPYWIWLHYISLLKYPFEAAMQNEFGDDPSKCFETGVEIFDATPLGGVPYGMKLKLLENLGDALGMKNVTGSTCFRTGADVLNRMEITQLGKWDCFWVIVAWGCFSRILCYFSLLLGSKNKRK